MQETPPNRNPLNYTPFEFPRAGPSTSEFGVPNNPMGNIFEPNMTNSASSTGYRYVDDKSESNTLPSTSSHSQNAARTTLPKFGMFIKVFRTEISPFINRLHLFDFCL